MADGSDYKDRFAKAMSAANKDANNHCSHRWRAGVLAAWGGYAISHSGGLDAYGCHTDHKTGLYHCHK